MAETPPSFETEPDAADDLSTVEAPVPAEADPLPEGDPLPDESAPAGGEGDPAAVDPDAVPAEAEEQADAFAAAASVTDAPVPAAAAAAPSGPKTPEQRNAERLERRAQSAAQRRRYRERTKRKRAEARAVTPAREPDAAEVHGSGRPKIRQGVVISDKPDKTVVVRVDDAKRHQRYRKILRTSSALHVHDESNSASAGDTVRVVESRPLSATKRWRLMEILERAR